MNSPVKNWRNTKQLHKLLGKTGKIITWTEVFIAPIGFEQEVPYAVAIVELSSGKRITAQVVDCNQELLVGQKVITVVRKVGIQNPTDVILYGIKVMPI